MLKLKPGNVIQKLNKMDKKQAYTWGAIVLVCFIALITLATFMGNAEDASFEDFNTRGYDLAQMPFLNDEAEEYLLASKYPDMKDNNATLLYSQQQKEARQAEDAAEAEEGAVSEDSSEDSSNNGYSGGYSGRGYGGYSGGGSSSPTQVGQLGTASMGRSGGSGVSATWGAPRGDFSTFKSQDKGTETPMAQLKNQDARRALSQFSQTSRAAAGLRDGKAANAKRALMGGHIQGSEAFTDSGIDLSKATGLAIDPDGDFSSDFSGLEDAISDAANTAKEAKDEFEEESMSPLLQQFLSGMVNIGVDLIGDALNWGMDAIKGSAAANQAGNQVVDNAASSLWGTPLNQMTPDQQQMLAAGLGTTVDNIDFTKDTTGGSFISTQTGIKDPGGPAVVSSRITSTKKEGSTGDKLYSYGDTDYETWGEAWEARRQDRNAYNEFKDNLESGYLAQGNSEWATNYQNARSDAWAPYTGNRSGGGYGSSGRSSSGGGTGNSDIDRIMNSNRTQTEKVTELEGWGMTHDRACQTVYGHSNC